MFSKLDYVYAVYSEKSFTRAAEKLFISQPSLSAAIKNLEKQIGAPLFERGAGKVAPTEIGREYIRCAERIISIRKDFVKKINDMNTSEAGKLTVGGSNYLCSYVLSRIINRFTGLYPKVDVILTDTTSKRLPGMLDDESVDLVIDNFSNNSHMYDAFPLIEEEILLCVPIDNPINQRLSKYALTCEAFGDREILSGFPAVPIELFADESFILLKSGNDMRSRAEGIFAEANITPNVSFYVDQLNISYSLAEVGLGVCFMSDTFFRFSKVPENIVLYKVQSEFANRTLYIARKKHRYCTRAMQKFIEVAHAIVQKEF